MRRTVLLLVIISAACMGMPGGSAYEVPDLQGAGLTAAQATGDDCINEEPCPVVGPMVNCVRNGLQC